jgi:hypothetical protein
MRTTVYLQYRSPHVRKIFFVLEPSGAQICHVSDIRKPAALLKLAVTSLQGARLVASSDTRPVHSLSLDFQEGAFFPEQTYETRRAHASTGFTS